MIKEIRYGGLSAQPNEYISEDGESALLMNLVPDSGGLKSIAEWDVVSALEEGDILLHIHERGAIEHYIIKRVFDVEINGEKVVREALYWREIDGEPNSKMHLRNFDNVKILECATVGNTLMTITEEGIHYFLWKTDRYKYLGTEIPAFKAKPYLNTNFIDSTEFTKRYELDAEFKTTTTIYGDGYIPKETALQLAKYEIERIILFGEAQQKIAEKVFALMGSMKTFLRKEGFFLFPFYVRFAYRMYDGTHVKHTPPILMTPTSWGKPLMIVYISDTGEVVFDPIFSTSELFSVLDLPESLDDWGDILTHIDVFVSEPLVDYTEDAQSLSCVTRLPCYNFIEEEGGILKYNADKAPFAMIQDYDTEELRLIDIPTGLENQYGEAEWRLNRGGWFPKNTGIPLGISKQGYKKCYLAFNISNVDDDFYIADAKMGTIVPPYLGDEDFGLPSGDGIKYAIYDSDELTKYNLVRFSHEVKVTYIRGPITAETKERSIFYIESERVDGKDYKDVLIDVSNFYKVSEIELFNYAGVRQIDAPISMKKHELLNIETHQTLSDLGQSIHMPIASTAFAYNNRLNIVVDSMQLKPGGVDLDYINPHKRGTPKNTISPTPFDYAFVEIIENSQTAYIKIPINGGEIQMNDIMYFAFPHNTAQKLIVGHRNVPNEEWYIPLKGHPLLNMSYAFDEFKPLPFARCAKTIIGSDKIKHGNIVMASTIENPFHFPENLRSQLPVKEVKTLSASVKALSEGQFGQFPLYAFTDEGVWALEITNEGKFAGKQPISRDVCINKDSVTQIDQAVLFATNRGVMLISGSETTCITDIIDTDYPILINNMPGGDKLIEMSGIPNNALSIQPFADFIEGVRMIYDYTHQRIYFYNQQRYAYVYSLKTKQWGMCESNIDYSINSYPEALAVTTDNKIIDLSSTNTGDARGGFMVSRALKLDVADELKTINTIVQRGDFNRGDVSTILWGSRDLKNWHLVWSSKDHYMRGFRGTPYKYYRIGALTNLGKDESLIGASLNYEPKQTNKIR